MGEVLGLDGRSECFIWCGFALFLWVVCLDITPCTSAEIPPAGAPSGFDSAAMFDFTA